MTTEPTDQHAYTTYVQMAGRIVFREPSLSLLDLAPATVFMTEPPGHSVGYLPTGMFLDRWYAEDDGSGIRPVLAVLSLLDPAQTLASDPSLMVSLPRIRGSGIEYQAVVLAGAVPVSAGACVLFIRPQGMPSTPGDASWSGELPAPPSPAA